MDGGSCDALLFFFFGLTRKHFVGRFKNLDDWIIKKFKWLIDSFIHYDFVIMASPPPPSPVPTPKTIIILLAYCQLYLLIHIQRYAHYNIGNIHFVCIYAMYTCIHVLYLTYGWLSFEVYMCKLNEYRIFRRWNKEFATLIRNKRMNIWLITRTVAYLQKSYGFTIYVERHLF